MQGQRVFLSWFSPLPLGRGRFAGGPRPPEQTGQALRFPLAGAHPFVVGSAVPGAVRGHTDAGCPMPWGTDHLL